MPIPLSHYRDRFYWAIAPVQVLRIPPSCVPGIPRFTSRWVRHEKWVKEPDRQKWRWSPQVVTRQQKLRWWQIWCSETSKHSRQQGHWFVNDSLHQVAVVRVDYVCAGD